jgi:tetratricopeptide (TPR) repeat protein
MCYDKALEKRPYGYASYKKGMLLKQLSRYEEALECFEKSYGDTAEWVISLMKLQEQALRDKLKPNEDGSTKSFETYCRVLGKLLKEDGTMFHPEIEFARKKLNENILQHIHEPNPDWYDKEGNVQDVVEVGEWLENIGREKEALEFYDKELEKSLEKGDLYSACSDTIIRTYRWKSIGRTKDVLDLYNKIIQFCEKFESLDYDKREAALSEVGASGADYVAQCLAESYEGKADNFADSGNMDKAIECIDHAIKLEREHPFEEYRGCWQKKMKWLPDEEAIKFIDEEIKAVKSIYAKNSWLDDEDKKDTIQGLESSKNELLKKLAT